MLQNTGELIMYIGAALCLIFLIIIFGLRVLAHRGKVTLNWKKLLLTLSILLVGIVCIFAGDSLRKSMSKDMMLSFYENNLTYEELTRAQQKNIEAAWVLLPKDHRNGEDVTAYLPALEDYVFQAYVFMGIPEEQAAESTTRLMMEFED